MYIDDPVLDPNALAEANRNAIAPPSLAISQLASESQDALIEMLSNLLDQLISRNDPLPVAKLTHFHAKSPPQINIQLYLQRFAKYAPVGNECFVLLLVYLDRLVQRTGSIITSLNIHRLLLTAILIASKFCQDKYYTNRHFSKVGGLPLNELNMLELEFLTHLDFDLNTSLDWLEKYYVQLRTHFQRKHGAPTAAAASAAYSTNGQYPTGNATIEASAAAP
ncbi:cyclin [Capsaspora owczarzaki ATCC 30864]|uniref:Cyclin n=1 Tax=Capsaspora owczarzaki (strain ATCC 30864) TaxID=595528 RepID=A0A0D2U158_CAPO3|nr:cyclin [Capsaspora owczarzaki ATCC 30864]